MDKFVKINSVQGSDFTKAQNLVDFVIPAGMGVVNLRDSYINLNVKPYAKLLEVFLEKRLHLNLIR